MNTLVSIIVGVGIGLLTSIVAWLITMLFLSPRLNISSVEQDPASQFFVSSRRRKRSVIDVNVTCSLNIPHDREENVLALQVSSGSFPVVSPGWSRKITISTDLASLTEFGQARLNERLGGLNPGKKCSDISSILEVFDLLPSAYIQVAAFSTDPISGKRNVTSRSLTCHRSSSGSRS